MSFQDCKLIVLNSANALRNNSSLLSDVLFPFTGVLKEDHDIFYSTIGIVNASLPVSFYVINSNNNVLKIQNNTTLITYSIVIPIGNYNANGLIANLTTQIQALGFSTFSLAINRSNGILTFSFPSSFTIMASSSIFTVLGFYGTASITGTSITASYPLNLLGTKKVKIFSSLLATIGVDSQTRYSSGTLATINVSDSPFGMIQFLNQSSYYAKLRMRKIDNIDIKLLDENGNLLDFNNVDWVITLQLVTYRHLVQEESILDLNKLAIGPSLSGIKDLPIHQENETRTEDPELALLLMDQSNSA